MQFNSLILMNFLLLMIMVLYASASIEEELKIIENNLDVDSQVQEYLKHGLETLVNLFEDGNNTVNSDELSFPSPSGSDAGSVFGLIRQFSPSASFNAATQMFHQTRSAPSSPIENKIGGFKQFSRSSSLNTRRPTSISPASPIGSIAGGVAGFMRQFSNSFNSQSSTKTNKSYGWAHSAKFGREVIIPTAVGYLQEEIGALRNVLNEIYESFEKIPDNLKNYVPHNLTVDNYSNPVIINSQLISDFESWVIRANRIISKENATEEDLCSLFYLNEKLRFKKQLEFLTIDDWFKLETKDNFRSWLSYNADSNENVKVKNMRINLGKVAVKSYQIYWLYSIPTMVCSRHFYTSYEESIEKIKINLEKQLEYANEQKQALFNAKKTLNLLKQNLFEKKDYNKNNKFIINLKLLENSPIKGIYYGYKFEKFVKKVELDIQKDIKKIIDLEKKILFKKNVELSNQVQFAQTRSSPRNEPRKLMPPSSGENSPRRLLPLTPQQFVHRQLHLGDVTGLINKPSTLKITSLKIPKMGQINENQKLENILSPKKQEQNITVDKNKHQEVEKYPIEELSNADIEKIDFGRVKKLKNEHESSSSSTIRNDEKEKQTKLETSEIDQNIHKNETKIELKNKNVEKPKMEGDKLEKSEIKEKEVKLIKENEKTKIFNNLTLKEEFKNKEPKNEGLSIALPQLGIQNPLPVINPIKDYGASIKAI